MRDSGARRNLSEEPVRHGFSEDDIRLDLKGNFYRAVEVMSAVTVRQRARRGK